MKIIVHYDHPPIPSRAFDYSAIYEGYEGGDIIGRGATEKEAIIDLECQKAERDSENV